jgi:hypothetical protein
LDDDGGLSIFRLASDGLLGRGRQLAILHRQGAHVLDRLQHVALLSQKGVSKSVCPAHILIQFRQHIRECHQRLNAGVPGLLLRGFHQGLALQGTVILEPLLGFHNLEWIGGGYHHLREQWIRIKRNGSNQIVELLGRQ